MSVMAARDITSSSVHASGAPSAGKGASAAVQQSKVFDYFDKPAFLMIENDGHIDWHAKPETRSSGTETPTNALLLQTDSHGVREELLNRSPRAPNSRRYSVSNFIRLFATTYGLLLLYLACQPSLVAWFPRDRSGGGMSETSSVRMRLWRRYLGAGAGSLEQGFNDAPVDQGLLNRLRQVSSTSRAALDRGSDADETSSVLSVGEVGADRVANVDWQDPPSGDGTKAEGAGADGRSRSSAQLGGRSRERIIPTRQVIEDVRATKLRPSWPRSRKDILSQYDESFDSDDSDDEGLFHDVAARSIRMKLLRAVRRGRWPEIRAIVEDPNSKKDVREVLMARDADDKGGLLVLAAAGGFHEVLTQLAEVIRVQLGTAVLADQLREADEEERPLLFLAALSGSTPTFLAAHKLLRKTLGSGGVEQQFRHTGAIEGNLLMHAARGGEDGTWEEVWKVLEKYDWLYEEIHGVDTKGRTVLLHAAEAGNTALVRKIIDLGLDMEKMTDSNGWTALMYAARGGRGDRVVSLLLDLYSGDPESLKAELTKVGLDSSTLLMHAALGGQTTTFSTLRKVMYPGEKEKNVKHPDDPEERVRIEAKLLAWAAEGGSVKILNKIAEGIKVNEFGDAMAGGWFELGLGNWYETGGNTPHAAQRLKEVLTACAQTGGGSLFISAIDSGKLDMLKIVVKGIKQLFKDPEERWRMLCGFPREHEGNPLKLAATESVMVFSETLKALEGECTPNDEAGKLKLQFKLMPTNNAEETPLYGAVCSGDTELFARVLDGIQERFPDEPPTGRQIIQQVSAALRVREGDERKKWISASMLPVVLKAARDADRSVGALGPPPYDTSLLDDAVSTAVELNAFEHLRTLVKNGCRLASQFPNLLSKIGETESKISEFICLSIISARNPFAVCSVALHDIHDSDTKYPVNRRALQRLEGKIVEIIIKLLEHLPGSVYEVGAELARGDGKLKDQPFELLGFVVMRWMLEHSGTEGLTGEGLRLKARMPLLVHAVSSATDFLDLLSAPLVVDYLRLEFTRTLPSVSTVDPFERSIIQNFCSYKPQDKGDTERDPRDIWQNLLEFLQGWRENGITAFPHRTILPGLQFILAGITGKPEAFYPVPAIRMYFGVLCYLAMMAIFLRVVVLRTDTISGWEWLFYLILAGIICQEALEFVRAKKSLQGPPSIERYFSDAWNFLDVASIVVVAMAFSFRMAGDTTRAQLFLAISAPFLFSRVLFLSQIGSTLGPMTQVIFNMLTELATFSVVLLLVMLGFSTCFWALYGNESIAVDYDCEGREHSLNDAFGTFGDSLLTLFSAMLGNFSFEEFYDTEIDGEECSLKTYRNAGVVLLVAYLIIMTVMLLNLLIAVLSTAHAAVYRNAEKQFHAARAKLIVQSREDVVHDVLPPPFSLIKPMSGLLWPIRLAGEDKWDVTMRTVHRLIFALVVGMTAVLVTSLLWMVSLPWVTLALAKLMRKLSNHPRGTLAEGQSSSGRVEAGFARKKSKKTRAASGRISLRLLRNKSKNAGPGSAGGQSSTRASVLLEHDSGRTGDSTARLDGSRAGNQETLQRVFFVSTAGERLTWSDALTFLVFLGFILVALLGAVVMCFVVYPVLSIMLWIRGICGLWLYFKKSLRADPWARKQMALGEDGDEWSMARELAVRKNESLSNGKTFADDFNVAALLTTMTGLTMDDLWQDLSRSRTFLRSRELTVAMNDALRFGLTSKVR